MRHPQALKGRVGTAPELRATPKGTYVCSFNLAVDGNNDEDGNRTTVWHRITCWKEHAEVVAKAVCKGDLVLCEGNPEPPYVFQVKDADGNIMTDPDTGYPLMAAKPQMTSWRTVAIEYAERPLEATEAA